MIAAVKDQGHSFGGIVNYLLGPGRAEEHVDQRVIAASQEIEIPLGQQLDDPERLSLGTQLALYPALFPQACPTRGEVYHLVFSLPEGESLPDESWAEVARESARVLHLQAASGASAPWAAFRHGPTAEGLDHLHFVACLVRSDGSEVKTYLRRGYADLHAIARRAEERFGLQPLLSHGQGSVPSPQRGEREASARRGRAEPERLTLARTVRSAAQASANEAQFLEGLTRAGVLFRPRYQKDTTTVVVGYSVAMRPPSGAKPVWFGGGKLARDLTLPALRSQWTAPAEAATSDLARAWAGRRGSQLSGRPTPATASSQATLRAWGRAADRLEELGHRIAEAQPMPAAAWTGLAREAAGVTAALARRLEPQRPGELSAAADALARCAQRSIGEPASDPAPMAMRGVAAICSQYRMGGAAQGWLRVVAELARLAETLSRAAEAADELSHQSAMADIAAGELRAAGRALAAHPPEQLFAQRQERRVDPSAPLRPSRAARQDRSQSGIDAPLPRVPEAEQHRRPRSGPELGL